MLDKTNDRVSSEIKDAIVEELRDIEQRNQIRILFAAESGSRAWGFHSPNSDYDIRFIYVHKPEWYLELPKRKDTISFPIEDGMDVCGWDFRKALRLLTHGNAQILEWMNSSVVYLDLENIREKIVRVAEAGPTRQMLARHYAGFGYSQFKDFVKDQDQVLLKKYLYVIRPILALKWISQHKGIEIPICARTLLQEIKIRPSMKELMTELIHEKSIQSEDVSTPRILKIDKYAIETFQWAWQKYPKPKACIEQIEKAHDLIFETILRT